MKGLIVERQADLSRLYPSWEKKTIWKFFETTANRFPNREFVVTEDGERYTYSQAKNKVLAIAQSLLSIGVRPGDHVAIQMENSAKLVFVALAVAAVRAVKVPVNISLGQREVSYIVNQSDASYFFAGCPVNLTGVETHLRQIVVLPSIECEADIPIVAWEDFLAAGGDGELPDSDGAQYADEISDIVYTSGSTSAPKGVPLTHDMLMRNVFASCFDRGVEIGRRMFVPLPLFQLHDS